MGNQDLDELPAIPGLEETHQAGAWSLRVAWDHGTGWAAGTLAAAAFLLAVAMLSIGMAALALASVMATLVLGYVAAVAFRNSTLIRIEEGKLLVTHGPMPWARGLELDADEITDVACQRSGFGQSAQWRVRADLGDGGHAWLLPGYHFLSLAAMQGVAPRIKRGLGLRLSFESEDDDEET
jgi:hypothetical protein